MEIESANSRIGRANYLSYGSRDGAFRLTPFPLCSHPLLLIRRIYSGSVVLGGGEIHRWVTNSNLSRLLATTPHFLYVKAIGFSTDTSLFRAHRRSGVIFIPQIHDLGKFGFLVLQHARCFVCGIVGALFINYNGCPLREKRCYFTPILDGLSFLSSRSFFWRVNSRGHFYRRLGKTFLLFPRIDVFRFPIRACRFSPCVAAPGSYTSTRRYIRCSCRQ